MFLMHLIRFCSCQLCFVLLIFAWLFRLPCILTLHFLDVISLHGIAIPKGLYYTAVVFLSFFFLLFWRLFSEVAEWISTKLGHIFTYIYLYLRKFGPNSRAIYPYGLGGKNAFLGLTMNFGRTYLCSRTWYQQWERNLSVYRDFSTCSPNWERLASFVPPP